MDDGVRNLQAVIMDQIKKHTGRNDFLVFFINLIPKIIVIATCPLYVVVDHFYFLGFFFSLPAYKRDMQRIGHSFRNCSAAFDADKNACKFKVCMPSLKYWEPMLIQGRLILVLDCQNLVSAIRFTGETYEGIGQLYEEQVGGYWTKTKSGVEL